MKKLLVVFSLFIGMVGISHAGGRAGAGWKAYTVNVSSAQVFVGHGFFNSLFLSTGCNPGDYTIAFDTVAISTSTGLGFTNLSDLTIGTTTVLTPAILFGTTSTANSNSYTPGSGYWSAGQAPDDYVEVMAGLFIWKNAIGLGGCDKVTAYYSR